MAEQQHDKDDELKPCPCCGGKASIGNSEPDGSGGYFVECDDCGVTTPLIYNMMGTVRRELLDKWNRRVVRPETQHIGTIPKGTTFNAAGQEVDATQGGRSQPPAPAAPTGDTPRTDEAEFSATWGDKEYKVVSSEVARQFERELAEAQRARLDLSMTLNVERASRSATQPLEPTQAMIDAGRLAIEQGRGAKSVWLEMAARAPASTTGHGWIPVSERLPVGDDDVLAFDVRGKVHGKSAHNVRTAWHMAVAEKDTCFYTHWKPLPEGPVVQSATQERKND